MSAFIPARELCQLRASCFCHGSGLFIFGGSIEEEGRGLRAFQGGTSALKHNWSTRMWP